MGNHFQCRRGLETRTTGANRGGLGKSSRARGTAPVEREAQTSGPTLKARVSLAASRASLASPVPRVELFLRDRNVPAGCVFDVDDGAALPLLQAHRRGLDLRQRL